MDTIKRQISYFVRGDYLFKEERLNDYSVFKNYIQYFEKQLIDLNDILFNDCCYTDFFR